MKDLMQVADAVWMVRPAFFKWNTETSATNPFQKNIDATDEEIHGAALEEFDRTVECIRDCGIKVIVSQHTDLLTPDAIFPNNRISFHHNGTVVRYPMYATSRRRERQEDYPKEISDQYRVESVIDLTGEEDHNCFLEGTGSLVFDHKNKKAYASISPRTSETLVRTLCDQLNYTPVIFNACLKNGEAVYHTNVLLHIGETYVVVCSAAITDTHQRESVLTELKKSGRTIIAINFDELATFAGNMLQLRCNDGEIITLLSANAFDHLTDEHLDVLLDHAKLLPVPIPVIETVGGGSVRCMMTEIFLPKKKDSDGE